MKNFDGFYQKNDKNLPNAAIKNINFAAKGGELIGITGAVGSGKSALIGAILSEMPYYRGHFKVTGTIAYV